MDQEYQLSHSELALSKLNRAAELAWSVAGNSIFVKSHSNKPLDLCIPDLSHETAAQRTKIGTEILVLLNTIDENLLPHDSALTAYLLKYYAEIWSKDTEYYWLRCELTGHLIYGPFTQTTYIMGFAFGYINNSLRAVTFNNDIDGDRYLVLLSEIARLLRQIYIRTEGQAERGIRIHKLQLPSVRELLTHLKNTADTDYRVNKQRLTNLSNPSEITQAINHRVDKQILPAFMQLLEQLDDNYELAAPDGVGMDKLPGGREVYLDLIKINTTRKLTPEQVHQAGLARIARLEVEMEEIRKQLGFAGTADDFLTHLRNEPRACAKDAEDIGAKMRYHKDRVEKRLDEFFTQRPVADYDVERLDAALEGSMTWGYYQPPTSYEPRGLYFYNGSRLNSQAVIGAASLTFHELVPGHHLHVSAQLVNENLLPIRRYALINAYNEGWAEYAATLTGEMGLYDDPYDHYGRLIFDAFHSSRLVVDTGMNALGWSWEDAKAYMAKHTLCTASEIETDTLRYSCSTPAQALAYKLGDDEILRMRQKTQDKLGDRFSYRSFHSAVLAPGGLPFPALESHLDWFIAQQLESV